MKFISFGSGSCGNCYYIFSNGCGILIDAGIGIRKLKKSFSDNGLSLSDVKYILITHDHADHVKAVGVISNAYGLPVYATNRVHEGIRRNYCVNKKVDSNNIRMLSVDERLTVGEFTVEPFSVPHDSLDNVGYKITVENKTFCLMTDVGRITDEVSAAISEADYLVIEANYDENMLWSGKYPVSLKRRVSGGDGHLSNMQCAKAIVSYASDNLCHVWLCHLSGDNNRPDIALETVKEVLGKSDNNRLKSLQIDVLRRGVVSRIFDM